MDRIITSQNTNDIKVIRVVWGNFDTSNLPATPQFNEVVYVWGKDTRDSLKTMGYETVLMSRDTLDYKFTHPNYQFIHKLIGIESAMKTYSKILFLDWDCYVVKDLDGDFFNSLENKSLLAPIYSYAKSEFETIYDKADEWYELQSNLLNTNSWDKDDMFIIPNAGFIYISDSSIATELVLLAKKNNITTLIEEFTLHSYTNTTLDSYIETYHPTCLYGKSGTNDINNYIDSKLNMNIYFEHN